MYGLILENIAAFLKKEYSKQTWEEICIIADLQTEDYETHTVYSEGLVPRLIRSSQEVTNSPVDELMEKVGYSFYEYITKFEYHKMLRVLGRTFPDFLNGLDNLHEYLRFSYPQLKPPSFYCEHESKTGLTLHYRSKRRGFLSYVKGQLRCIAKVLYDIDVNVEVLDRDSDPVTGQEHVIFRLHFNNLKYKKHHQLHGSQSSLNQMLQENIKITSEVFFDIFPFTIVFNRGMRVRNLGLGLLRLIPRIVGKKVNHEFILLRPLLNFTWEEILLHTNNVFEIMSVDPIIRDGQVRYSTGDLHEVTEERRRMPPEERARYLSLRGQMLYMQDWECICFIAIPMMQDLPQMLKTGVFINDLALHDSSRELLLAGTQQQAEIRLLLHQEATKAERLTESAQRLEMERQRTNNLLYQLLPATVADKLRAGANPLDTCQSFDCVTVLFTDVVGFTSICSGLTPLAVVRFLNQMYSEFDEISHRRDVFKVETIGDAYVAVGGAPTPNPQHAERILLAGFDYIEAVRRIREVSTGKEILIRVGVHSGPAVAGVVGVRMPRYCLFGDTVLTANQFESEGEAMRVHCSEVAKKAAEAVGSSKFRFAKRKVVDTRSGQKFQSYLVEMSP